MLDGARSDAPSFDPQPESAVQASSPSTIRPSWRASCQMPSRGRLALANRYLDLLFITATMAIMETGDKVMLAVAAISFALIMCLNLRAWFPSVLGWILIGFLVENAALLSYRLLKSVTSVEKMEVHAKKFAAADAEVLGERAGDELGPSSFKPRYTTRTPERQACLTILGHLARRSTPSCTF